MPPFPKPDFQFSYRFDHEISALRRYRDTKQGRFIPAKDNQTLLLATWNIANLGEHERRDRDYKLIAEMISWFDIVAIQEAKDDLSGLREIVRYLPNCKLLFSDKAGNKERLAYIYDATKLQLLEKVGEIAIEPSSQRYIRFDGVEQKFKGFDRHPYIASFQIQNFRFVLVNVHLYFGSDASRDKNRRSLEAFAVGRWADLRTKSDYAYTKNIIALGDFNIPKPIKGDPIYDALSKRGLKVPEHSSGIGTTLANENFYDQISFIPKSMKSRFKKQGLFDFDGGVFARLWDSRSEQEFRSYVKYYLSDHRILWAQFDIT